MSATSHATPKGNPQQILATVWQRNLPLLRLRLRALRDAADQNCASDLSAQSRIEAADIAHKLAGSLGMFGYPEGSEIAKRLELLLDGESPLPAPTFQELTAQLEKSLSL